MDLSLSVSTPFMEKLRVELNQTDQEVIQDALSILRWMVDEAKQGRVVVSADPDGNEVKRLSVKSVNGVLRERGVEIKD